MPTVHYNPKIRPVTSVSHRTVVVRPHAFLKAQGQSESATLPHHIQRSKQTQKNGKNVAAFNSKRYETQFLMKDFELSDKFEEV